MPSGHVGLLTVHLMHHMPAPIHPLCVHGFLLLFWCIQVCLFLLNGSVLQFSSVQSLSHIRLFVTTWTAAHQASLSITNSRSLLKLVSIELVMPSDHLILCCPLLLLPSTFPIIRVFSNELALCMRWTSIGVSSSTSVLPMNIQD